MSTINVLRSLLIAALFVSGAAAAADNTITVVAEEGSTVAEFKVGDSRCVLKEDRLQCVPVSK
jgi:serine/threonine protein phosphatase PrpC